MQAAAQAVGLTEIVVNQDGAMTKRADRIAQAVSDRGVHFLEVEILEETRQGRRKKEWQEEGLPEPKERENCGRDTSQGRRTHLSRSSTDRTKRSQDENEAKDEKGKRKAADAEHMEQEKTVNTPTVVKRENPKEWRCTRVMNEGKGDSVVREPTNRRQR